MELDSDATLSQPTAINRLLKSISQRYQSLLDAWTPFVIGRWLFTLFVLVFFLGRVLYYQGWYIVTYALGIYYLNMLIAFLTPKIDPALYDDFEDEDGPVLPTTTSEEFRPFIRRLPEFKFWHTSTKATLIAWFCTFFEIFNIPVFWPILLLYFITLFSVTMKRQIKHMIKYRYLPWTRGKTKYLGKEDTGRVVNTNSK